MPLKEVRDKCTLLLNLRLVGFQRRDISDTFDASDAIRNFGESKVDGPGPEGFEVPHPKSSKSPQFVLLDSERNGTVCEKADRKSAVNAGEAENGRTCHVLFCSKRKPSITAEADHSTMRSRVAIVFV